MPSTQKANQKVGRERERERREARPLWHGSHFHKITLEMSVCSKFVHTGKSNANLKSRFRAGKDKYFPTAA